MTEKQWQQGREKNQFTRSFGKEGIHISLLSKVLFWVQREGSAVFSGNKTTYVAEYQKSQKSQ